MTQPPQDEPTAAGPEELRRQVERTRHELGETVEALSAKTDVKARAQEKATALKEQAGATASHLSEQARTKATALKEQAGTTASHLSEQARTKATEAAHLLEEKVPAPVKDTAAATAVQVRAKAGQAEQLWQEKAPRQVRDHRGALIGAAAAVALAYLLLRRSKN
ncbi:DUF3618 domain-containing protein [Streptomyces sp. NPDC005859]|uniref:DUF3618 domain-containing protein n=1 Tax=Streptomyces sp. NPDC005859 TaxID=3157170 RepID=UPI0033E9B445